MADHVPTITDMLDMKTRDRIALLEERIHSAVADFDQRSVALRSEAGIHRELCRLLVVEAQYPLAWVGSVDRSNRLSILASCGEDAAELGGALEALGRESDSSGRVARLLDDRTPRIVSLPLSADSEAVPHFGHGALALLPLSIDDPPSRWLFLYADDQLSLTLSVFRLLKELAHTATITLERVAELSARLHAEGNTEIGLLRWGSVVSSAPIGLIAFSEDGRIALANDAARAMAGIPAALAMGRMPSSMVRSNLDVDAIVSRIAREPGVWSGEGWIIVKGGRRLWARVSLVHGSLSPGRPGAIAIIVDSTTEHVLSRRAGHRKRALERARREAASAIDRERRDIAMGLHDNLGQLLAAIRINLGVIGATVKDENVAARVEICRSLAEDAVAATRNFTYALYPPVLHGAGLNAALKWLVNKHDDEDVTSWSYSGKDVEMDVDRAGVLYRVTSELMANVRRHACAQAGSVTLDSTPDKITIVVHDDGTGFPPESEQAFGLGLSSVTVLLDRLGGGLEIESRGGHTSAKVTVPVDRRTFGRTGRD
jgi:PAS domain S-box-containing protein